VSGQLHAPAALPPGKRVPQYPLDRRLGGPQSRSGRLEEEKILDPTGTRTPTSPPSSQLASRYTDYAAPAPQMIMQEVILVFTAELYTVRCTTARPAGVETREITRTYNTSCYIYSLNIMRWTSHMDLFSIYVQKLQAYPGFILGNKFVICGVIASYSNVSNFLAINTNIFFSVQSSPVV
jgi:hypothetical protein